MTISLDLRTRLAGWAVAALAIFWLAGCDSSGLGRVVPVSGAVTEDGKAISKGNVTFYPEDGKTDFLPAGTIDEQGKYTLSTRGKAGAPPGKYKVVVAVQVPSDPKDPYSVPKSLVNEKYSKSETTPLLVEVKEAASAGEYDLQLKK